MHFPPPPSLCSFQPCLSKSDISRLGFYGRGKLTGMWAAVIRISTLKKSITWFSDEGDLGSSAKQRHNPIMRLLPSLWVTARDLWIFSLQDPVVVARKVANSKLAGSGKSRCFISIDESACIPIRDQRGWFPTFICEGNRDGSTGNLI